MSNPLQHSQLDDGQLDKQMWAVQCNMDLFRRRFHDKNMTIYNLQNNFGREREDLRREIQALKLQLAAAKCKGKRKHTMLQDSDDEWQRPEGCYAQVQEVIQDHPEACSDDTVCQGIEANLRTEQKAEVKVTKQRRLLRKDALADPLALATQRCESAHTVLEGNENSHGRAQQKHKRRTVRTGSV